MLHCGFAEFLYQGLSLSFKTLCLPQIKEICVWLSAMLLPDTGLSSDMHLVLLG